MLDIVNGRYSPPAIYWFRGLGEGKGFAAREELLPGEKGYSMSTANTGDLDGDGRLDLVIGDTSGKVFWSRNEGDGKQPRFRERKPVQTVDGDLKVSHKSDPYAVDWDGDGELDLLVGDEVTDVHLFRGRGDGTFEQGVSLFTGLTCDPKDGYRQASAKIEGKRVVPGYRLRVGTADWNGDGKLDLLLGNVLSGEQRTDPTTGHVWVLLRR